LSAFRIGEKFDIRDLRRTFRVRSSRNGPILPLIQPRVGKKAALGPA
jgi:hypothetical protein